MIEQIGRYRVREPLGEGAMGRVFLARDPVLDRDVAIKLLREDLGLSTEQRQTLFERMRHEARASARVSHPNIVVLHDMGEDPELGLFLVFEHVVGPTLKTALEQGRLGPTRTARLAREIGSALATAHRAGVLHRDVKPENLFLAGSGAKIADFGIARVPDSTLTRDGGLLGTPAYSSPEAIEHGEFSPGSDQFSMAATLYEALSGARAFPGDDAVTVANRITTSLPKPLATALGLDPHVDVVLARAFARRPDDRWPSAEDFGNALAEALELPRRAQMPTIPDTRHRAHPLASDLLRWAVALAVGAGAGATLTALTLEPAGSADTAGQQVAQPQQPAPNQPPTRATVLKPRPVAPRSPPTDAAAERTQQPADAASVTLPSPAIDAQADLAADH